MKRPFKRKSNSVEEDTIHEERGEDILETPCVFMCLYLG